MEDFKNTTEEELFAKRKELANNIRNNDIPKAKADGEQTLQHIKDNFSSISKEELAGVTLEYSKDVFKFCDYVLTTVRDIIQYEPDKKYQKMFMTAAKEYSKQDSLVNKLENDSSAYSKGKLLKVLEKQVKRLPELMEFFVTLSEVLTNVLYS